MRRMELTGPVAHPVLMIGCRAPRYGSDDRAAVDVLAGVIDARLRHYLEVNEHPMCSSTIVRTLAMEDDGCLYIGATLLPGASVTAVERILTVQLNLLRSEGMYISGADFAAVRDAVCNAILHGRQTVQGMAQQIGQAVAAGGDVGDCDRYLRRMRKLTPTDVRAVMKKYVRPQGMTVVVINPDPVGVGEHPSDLRDDSPNITAAKDATGDACAVAFPVGYPTTAPIAEQTVPVREHPVQHFQMRGLKVLVARDASADLALRLILPHGAEDDPPGKEGLGELTAELVEQMARTPDHDPDVGIPVHAPFEYEMHYGVDFTEMTVRAPTGLAGHLMHEIHRALNEELELGLFDSRLVTLKWKLFNEGIARNEREEPVADAELRTSVFAGTALGRGITVQSLRAISRKDLMQWRQRLFDPHGAILLMGGNLDVSRAKALVSQLLEGLPERDETTSSNAADGASTRPLHQPVNNSNAQSQPRIILVDSPDARQSVIRIGLRTPAWDHDALSAAQAGQWILAQRIWRQVRIEKGYAYNVTASFDRFRDTGELKVGTETACDKTGTTLAMLLASLRRISKEPVSDQELHDAKRAYGGRLAINLQTRGEQAQWRAMALLENENSDPTDQIWGVRAVDAKQVREIFSTCLGASRMVVVIVGPASTLKPQLDSIGKIEIRAMPNHRPGAATRPAYEELPRPM